MNKRYTHFKAFFVIVCESTILCGMRSCVHVFYEMNLMLTEPLSWSRGCKKVRDFIGRSIDWSVGRTISRLLICEKGMKENVRVIAKIFYRKSPNKACKAKYHIIDQEYRAKM